jgi:hypothetical protein
MGFRILVIFRSGSTDFFLEGTQALRSGWLLGWLGYFKIQFFE